MSDKERLRGFEQDHKPDGWPAIQMRDVTALLDIVEAQAKQIDALQADAERYRKLQCWMSSNVLEGWEKVEQLGALAAWDGHDAMTQELDSLPECNVGYHAARKQGGA
jgi:hypothetical protein